MDDEKYYEIVAQEIRENTIKDALWTKAIAKSMGDENKTKAVYIQLRVEQLIREEQSTSREAQIQAASDQAWDDEESGGLSEHNRQALMQWGKLLGEILVFAIGVFAIYKWLWPWLRSIRGQFMG